MNLRRPYLIARVNTFDAIHVLNGELTFREAGSLWCTVFLSEDELSILNAAGIETASYAPYDYTLQPLE